MSGLLEVVVLSPEDARRAEKGGADRLMLVGGLTGQGTSPEPGMFEYVRSVCTVPIRPLLRLREGYRTDGGEVSRLHGLVAGYLEAGADGVVLGFLNGYNQVDLEVVTELTDAGDWPWTFDHAIDRCLDVDAAWDALKGLRGLDQVLTAGSSRGLGRGLEDLLRRAQADPDAAALMMAGGGLVPEHLAWLTRAGVHAFQVGAQVRPGGSFAADVDASLVHTWRILVDAPRKP
ncbi:copper homeostasis protein CutC [Brooklawnia cerclae]|uniref:Copper homeostasis protein cutC homolog n=1 Tax=Brooklawnia cerclae TaxID=349934 RepID=A0ABX0SHZ1_9ACTN|nr:copper homeostasis protein CutC [Brooklawnia cerclae]NIH58023.1 copper homeostasis protein [Brooklawnia cerclae]